MVKFHHSWSAVKEANVLDDAYKENLSLYPRVDQKCPKVSCVYSRSIFPCDLELEFPARFIYALQQHKFRFCLPKCSDIRRKGRI